MIKKTIFSLTLGIACLSSSIHGMTERQVTKKQLENYKALKSSQFGTTMTKKKARTVPGTPQVQKPDLSKAIMQCEEILATEAVSVRQHAAVTGAMFSVTTKIDLGTIDSYNKFESLFIQIANLTLTLQKRVADLGNTQGVSGGALASLVAARQQLGAQGDTDWSTFVQSTMPLISQAPFNLADSSDVIIKSVYQQAQLLAKAIQKLETAPSGLLTAKAKKSLLSILGAYQNTVQTLSLMLTSAIEKMPESVDAATTSHYTTFAAKMAFGLGVSYALTRATAGMVNVDFYPAESFESTINLAYEIGGQLGQDYMTKAAGRVVVEAAKGGALYKAVSDVVDVPLEAARSKAQSAIKESMFSTQEKHAEEQEKVAAQILDNETIMSKMYAEITKTIADNIVQQLAAYVEDPNYGFAIDSSECTAAFQVLFNSLITLSDHIAGFAHANSAAGIALLNTMKDQELKGHNNRERFKIFARNIVPLLKQLPEPLGAPIEYATMVRFKNYEEQLARAESLFVFTPTERTAVTDQKNNGLLKDDILSPDAVNRLTTVIRSYRAAILSLNRVFDQIQDTLPGPRGTWWRAFQYVTGTRLFTFGKSVALTFGYTFAAASLATPSGWTYLFLTLAIPVAGNYALGVVGSGAKALISPETQSQEEMIENIKLKEQKREIQKKPALAPAQS
jgi:hypothetical protein